MAAKKTTFTSTKAPGVRRNSRTKQFEALVTRYLGSFPTIQTGGRTPGNVS